MNVDKFYNLESVPIEEEEQDDPVPLTTTDGLLDMYGLGDLEQPMQLPEINDPNMDYYQLDDWLRQLVDEV